MENIKSNMERDEELNGFSMTTWLILFTAIISISVFVIGNDALNVFSLHPDEILSSNFWNLVSYIFVHNGVFHLILNLFLLFSFGVLTERIIGRKDFLYFYLISGIFSGILSFFINKIFSETLFLRTDVLIGASSAIFAIAGLFIILLPRLKFTFLFLPVVSLPSFVFVPIILAVYWAVAFLLGISAGNVSQIAGLFIGIIYGAYLKEKYRSKMQLLHGVFREMEKEDIALFPEEDVSPVLRIAKDGIILYSNKSGVLLLKKWNSEVGKNAPKEIKDLILESLRSNKTKSVEIEIDGKFFLISFVPIVYSGYVNLYGLDISALKEAQAKLRERNVELASLASHEMRTPLTSIISLVPLIQQGKIGNVSSKQKETLDIIYHDAQRLDTIIRNMVDASRIDEGVAVYQFAKFNLQELLRSSIKTAYVMAKEKNVEVKLTTDKPFEIVSDKERLEQVVSNLIINALKYGYQGGNIWVSYKKEKEDVLIEVKDNGEGISKENLEVIFAKDFKVQKSAKRAIGGLGYGLYISRRIVEAHGGKLWAESQGKGAVFKILLPLNIGVSKEEVGNGKKEG